MWRIVVRVVGRWTVSDAGSLPVWDPLAVLDHVRIVVSAALTECGRTPVVEFSALGGAVLEECCGALMVAASDIYPATTPFPTPVPLGDPCGTMVALDVVVTMAHCFPMGDPPSQAAIAEAYANTSLDAAVIWNTVMQYRNTDLTQDGVWEIGNRSQSFTGPDGGCIMSVTLLTVGVDGPWCPCDTDSGG